MPLHKDLCLVGNVWVQSEASPPAHDYGVPLVYRICPSLGSCPLALRAFFLLPSLYRTPSLSLPTQARARAWDEPTTRLPQRPARADELTPLEHAKVCSAVSKVTDQVLPRTLRP